MKEKDKRRAYLKKFQKKNNPTHQEDNINRKNNFVRVITHQSQDENFYKIKYESDIIRINEDGDVYKGVIVGKGETRIVARITGQAFTFPVAICNSDADKKIKDAYVILEQLANK